MGSFSSYYRFRLRAGVRHLDWKERAPPSYCSMYIPSDFGPGGSFRKQRGLGRKRSHRICRTRTQHRHEQEISSSAIPSALRDRGLRHYVSDGHLPCGRTFIALGTDQASSGWDDDAYIGSSAH